jgi:hypothetical protein
MTTVINMYGQPFSIGFGSDDDARRTAYFKNGVGNLTPQEKSLLLKLGVDSLLENSLKPYLAKFFSALQTCTSDAALVLTPDCETSRFVVWSAFFHNREETLRRLKEQAAYKPHDLEMAMDAAFIKGIKPRRPPPGTGDISPVADENTIRRLFTLMLLDETPEVATGSEEDIRQLFTLMLLDGGAESAEEDTDDDDGAASAAGTDGSRG